MFQLVFTMGILVGLSLCIAGLVLRKSAARNLQVFVYIGVMLSTVSALLLVIQLKARNEARKRSKAIKRAKLEIGMVRISYRGGGSSIGHEMAIDGEKRKRLLEKR